MLLPIPSAKARISVSTTERGAFQLAGMAGGKGKSAFPIPDNILKQQTYSIFCISQEVIMAQNFLEKVFIVTFLNRSLKEKLPILIIFAT